MTPSTTPADGWMPDAHPFAMLLAMRQILLVEDDPKMSDQLAHSLADEGMKALPVLSAEALRETISGDGGFELIVLDRMMGALDTKCLIPQLKERWPHVPVLVLSAINTPWERATLIDVGADDYVGKPFITEELTARIRSLLRRAPDARSTTRRIGRAVLDLTNRRLSCRDGFEDLPQKEFLLLNVLSEKPGRVLSRTEILDLVWGNAHYSETNLVEATVTNLRRRIASIDCGFAVRNQRNVGYWIES